MGLLKWLLQTIKAHKGIAIGVCSVIVTGTIVLVIVANNLKNAPQTAEIVSSFTESVTSSETENESSEIQQITEVSSESTSSVPANHTPPVVQPPSDGYKLNTNQTVEDNVFIDALVYTGYKLDKQRADGNMWNYILWTQKRGLGYLSDITYGGGSSGYEKTSSGQPDIAFFERNGLVCASYATYVYFNYLPNVAGIDTSMLPKPANSRHANDWYAAVKKWVSLGYSKQVNFTASAPSMSQSNISFRNIDEMPIGSVVIFRDASKEQDYGSHVAIYTGYKNGYHWLHQVGNSNGPEMCAIERMLFGPDPQWPLYIVTPPQV